MCSGVHCKKRSGQNRAAHARKAKTNTETEHVRRKLKIKETESWERARSWTETWGQNTRRLPERHTGGACRGAGQMKGACAVARQKHGRNICGMSDRHTCGACTGSWTETGTTHP
jgi:hypothetical protein